MVSDGFPRGRGGHGMGHLDFPLPQARPPSITFSRVSRTRPTRCSQANIPAPSIVRSIFCLIKNA